MPSRMEVKSSETEYENVVEEYVEEESIQEVKITPADLLCKNTSSFKCLAQLTISRSSLMLDPYYWFPEVEDPKLDLALWTDGMKNFYNFN